MSQAASTQWEGRTDGTSWMHRNLMRLLRHVPLQLVYGVMAGAVVPGYIVATPSHFRAIYHYMRQRRGMSPLKALAWTYANHVRFGQVVIDRFAAFAGRRYQFDLEGYEHFEQLAQQSGGFMVMSAHVGCYELAGYAFKSRNKRFNALVYSGEAATVMENRNRLLEPNNIRMIPASDDLSHVIALSNALSDGEIVSVPGDRVFGSPRTLQCTLQGAPVALPMGPYRLAATRGVPVLAISVMKRSTSRYHVIIDRLDTQAPTQRSERTQYLADAMCRHIDGVLDRYPAQWFNFYEFWENNNDDNSHNTTPAG